MSNEISGVIQQIKVKQVGPQKKNAYDMQVGGQWYGYGFFAPKAKEGDYVTFTGVQNGNFWNVERGSLKVGKAPKEDTKPAVRQAVNSFDARQDAISRQAASNTAIAWLGLLHAAGALPISASKTKGAQQEALDIIRKEYEKEFYESNTGNEWKDIRPKSAGAEDEDNEYADEESDSVDDAPWT